MQICSNRERIVNGTNCRKPLDTNHFTLTFTKTFFCLPFRFFACFNSSPWITWIVNCSSFLLAVSGFEYRGNYNNTSQNWIDLSLFLSSYRLIEVLSIRSIAALEFKELNRFASSHKISTYQYFHSELFSRINTNTNCVQSIQIFLGHQSVWCTRRDRTLSAWVKESCAKTVRWFSKWWLFIPRAVRNWVNVAIGLVCRMEKRRNPNEIKAK